MYIYRYIYIYMRLIPNLFLYWQQMDRYAAPIAQIGEEGLALGFGLGPRAQVQLRNPL